LAACYSKESNIAKTTSNQQFDESEGLNNDVCVAASVFASTLTLTLKDVNELLKL
jgi:hypothetical protein